MIKTVTSGVAAEYVRALSEYLQQPSEAALSNAARLGRMALVESTSVLDIIMIHHAALGEALRTGGGPDPATVAQESALFLCEALSSFR
jgi:hypothetical protein